MEYFVASLSFGLTFGRLEAVLSDVVTVSSRVFVFSLGGAVCRV